MPKSVESVFIFQEGCEGEANAAAPTYDAIVVEQWTIIDVSRAAVVLIQAGSGKDAKFVCAEHCMLETSFGFHPCEFCPSGFWQCRLRNSVFQVTAV